MDIEHALHEAERWLDEIEGVQGVGQGKADGEDCITVFVSSKLVAGEIPDELHGFKVVVEESGLFTAGG